MDSVIDRITELSRSYTPEWRFDPDEPDIGSALAIVYARMMEQTYKRLSRVPEKNHIVFLNALGADLLPAVPAEGYVQFGLVNEEVDGVPVEEGTVVYADAEDAPDQVVAYETGEPMYATPASLTELFVTQDETDTIVRLYDREDEEWKPVQLFSVTGENRQCHELYIAHNTVLGIRREADIELEIEHSMSPGGMTKLYQALADPTVAVWEYATGENGWEAFESVDATSALLRLHKGKHQPAFSMRDQEGWESYWIRVRLLSIREIEKLRMSGVKLASFGREVLPDVIIGADEECELRRCLPFGERLDLYQTVYFGSEEVLSKKDALCTLSFRVDFARVPLETNESQSFNWEWVMRRSDFKPNYEFDVTVEKVVWEYFNGTGWTRLFSTDEHDRAFSVPDGVSGQYETLTFLVPDDIEPIQVGASETCFIRARILKINNLYKLQGQYVLPVIENTSLKYEYKLAQSGHDYILHNNLESVRPLEGATETTFQPFFRTGTQAMTGYFSFETSPAGAPVKILFDVVPTHSRDGRHLVWEYACGGKWKPLNLIDETAQLTKTGIITYTIPPDIRPVRLFGKERFWLRLVAEDGFAGEGKEPLILNRMQMNVTPVKEVGVRRLEYFRMELYQPDTRIDLPDKNICDADVWIDEKGGLNRAEEELLRQREDLEEEFGDDGELLHSWVRWQRVNDFYTSGAEDRQFILHRYAGQLEFGDGKRGRIPPPSEVENLRVRYVTGGGAYTNLPVDAIDRMDRAIGFINRVRNVSPLAGGLDPEKPEEGIRRETDGLCHQNRAVAIRDYEVLAMRASREISRVRCFSGYDGEGRNHAGAITLVAVLADHDGEPLHFSALKDKVSQYLKEHIHPALTGEGRLFIVPPEYVECRLYIELTVEDLGRVFRVKKEIEDRVREFLDPIRGKGGAGWEIGTFPDTIRIQNEISDIRGISYISKVVMNTYGLSGVNRGREIDIRRIPRNRYILPVPGEIEVVINS